MKNAQQCTGPRLMDRIDLRSHKQAEKVLNSLPSFKPLKRGKLPRPFNRVGGSSLHSTGLVHVGDDYLVCFMFKTGELWTDTHFYGYLLRRVGADLLSPLFEFHSHPSHKGFHCKMPCDDERDLTNRLLPGTPELAMKTQRLDPRIDVDRAELVKSFCRACGITLGWEDQRQRKLQL
jgi:hypothetical protein